MFKSFISSYPFLGVIRQKPKNTKQKTTLTAVTCISSIHSLTSPGSGSPLFPLGSPLAFYYLSFFPMKEPGPRDPFLGSPGNFRPRNHILKSKRRPYLTNQFILTRFFRLYFHPLSEEEKRRRAVRRLQLQLSRSTDYRDLRDIAR